MCYAAALKCQPFEVLQDMEIHITEVYQCFMQSQEWIVGIKALVDTKTVLMPQKKPQTLEGFLPQASYSFKARSKKDLRYLKNDTGMLNYLKAPLLVHRVERFSGHSQPKPSKPPKPHTLVLLPKTKHHLPAMHTLPPVPWETLASQSAFNTHRQNSFHHPGQLC